MRIRLSELRAIVRQVIAEGRDFSLSLATYENTLVVTNGSQILLPGQGKSPQMPDLKKLRLLPIPAEGDMLGSFDAKGLEMLRSAIHRAA